MARKVLKKAQFVSIAVFCCMVTSLGMVGMVPIVPLLSLCPRSIGLIIRIDVSGSAARTRRTISFNSLP